MLDRCFGACHEQIQFERAVDRHGIKICPIMHEHEKRSKYTMDAVAWYGLV